MPDELQISTLVPLQRTVPALHDDVALHAPLLHACGHCELTYQLPFTSQVWTAGEVLLQRLAPAVHWATAQALLVEAQV